MWYKLYNMLKEKIIMVIILFMTAALLFGYSIGRVNNSRDIVITNLEVALNNGDVNRLSKLLKLNDKKVSKDKLQPLINYYNKNSKAIDNDIKMLRNGDDTAAFVIKDRKKLFGSTYNVELKTYNVEVDSNYNEGKFTIDNKNYISGCERMENIIPGIYTISGKLKSEYGDIETTKEIVIMKDESIDVNFDAVSVTVQSQFKDADVYVNNKYTGLTVNEAEEMGPFKNDGSISMYIEKEFPWGRIKGDEVYITDMPVLNLNINMENSKMKNELGSTAEKFYKSVFVALNKESKSEIMAADDTAKNKIYSTLEKKYTFLRNKYSAENIEIMDDKSEYLYEDGIYKANVVVRVSYSTEKSIFGFNKEEKVNMFFTRFIYDDEKDEWIVNDVENFSL